MDLDEYLDRLTAWCEERGLDRQDAEAQRRFNDPEDDDNADG